MKIAIYARFGNKVESKLTEQEQKEAMQRIAEESHHMPSKKKAWLCIWNKSATDEDTRNLKDRLLKMVAENEGCEIVGTSEVEGDGEAVEKKVMELLKTEPPANGASAIYFAKFRPFEDIGYVKSMELYDKAKARGVELITADGTMAHMVKNYSNNRAELQAMDEFMNASKKRSMKEMFDKAVAEGATPMTLPKKKAWLFMRTSKGLSNGERSARLDILRRNAKEHGYDIVGETVVVGNSKQAKIELNHLLEHYLKDKPADTVFMRGLRDMSFKFGEIAEMYGMIKSAGVELRTADGSNQALDTNTEHGMKWHGMFAFIAKLQDDEAIKQLEGEKDEPNENSTHIIGGM